MMTDRNFLVVQTTWGSLRLTPVQLIQNSSTKLYSNHSDCMVCYTLDSLYFVCVMPAVTADFEILTLNIYFMS